MNRHFLARLPLLAVLLAAQPLAAQHLLNFRDADIRAFIADAAKVTGRTFVVDARVQGKVTVAGERPLSRAEYFEIFLSTLRANNLVAVPMANGNYRIQLFDGAASQPSTIGSKGASRNQLVTEIVRLRFLDAGQSLETVRPLISPQGAVTANRGANSLIIADFADNVRRVRALLDAVDRDTNTTRLIPLRNAGARDVSASLQQLGAGGQSGIAIAAIDSSNSIALSGNPGMVDRFAKLVDDLDQRAESASEIRVHFLQHANAQRLLPTLQQLVGGGSDPTPPSNSPAATGASGSTASMANPMGSRTGGSNGPSSSASAGANANNAPAATPTSGSIASYGPAIITRYEGANAIIVAANSDVQRKLGELIRQLDTRRPQVLVEAVIVEIGNDAAKKLGVQFLIGGKNMPFLATNYSNANPNILSLGGAAAGYALSKTTTTIDSNVVTTSDSSPFGTTFQESAANALLNATGGFAGGAGTFGNNGVFASIINAIRSDTSSNLLAVPHLVTLDNQPARFLVGQEVPIATGEALSKNFDNAFRTVQREEVGIKLEVTPQVNDSGEVMMTLRQEVSSIAGPVSTQSSDLVINKRSFETVLTADDGQILAIGGLLNDDERRTIERIPLLGDVPLLGQLFRSRSRSHAKTNLMVFIRPTVLRDSADNAAFTARRYGQLRAAQLARNPDTEPEIDLLVRDYLGTVPPVAAGRSDDAVIVPPPPASPPAGQP
jgi:general secretion pathway protein D